MKKTNFPVMSDADKLKQAVAHLHTIVDDLPDKPSASKMKKMAAWAGDLFHVDGVKVLAKFK